ncbi:MAG: hypothetical protein GWN71_34055, partial [Gammaproteobacteria bacterium]|nr:hypothetical protein [Gemmatimonadota bacterium]NIR40246.1 hypothetical protein [Actinomycetota bacterium]NIU78402.1 hypothetical protein [Gammaproteobacteria bacterium]
MKRIGAGIWLVMIAAWGCGDEGPTDVGGSLMEGALRTFEVVLEPTVFLVGDTTFGGLRSPATVGFRMVAEDFE